MQARCTYPIPPAGAGRGLVRVHRRRGPQQLPHPLHEPAGPDQRGGLPPDPGHPPRRDPEAGELAQQQRRPVNRDVMPGGQVRGLRAGLRPVAGPRPHVRGQLPLGDRPAARALLRLRHVLGDPRRRRRLDVGDLVAALRRHRLAGQARAAPAALRRRELQPLVRVIDQPHRRPRLARLLPRPPFPPLPQRPVPALLLIRAVRRRRPRRRGRVPPHLPLAAAQPARSARAISRYASASRAASSACGSAESSSAEGTPGTSGTTGNHHHPGPPVNNPPQRVAASPADPPRNQR